MTEENKTLTAAPEDAAASPLPEIEEAESAKTAETKSAEPKAAEPSEPKPAEPKPPAAKDEDSASKRISVLEGKLAAREAGVPKEYTEDVLTLARAEMKKNGASLKVDKHNQVIDRVYRLEQHGAVVDEELKVANHRIADLEEKG